ncbi:MAG: hypothetical protein QXV16_02705 [Candidatus Anstonellales archaeon]
MINLMLGMLLYIIFLNVLIHAMNSYVYIPVRMIALDTAIRSDIEYFS